MMQSVDTVWAESLCRFRNGEEQFEAVGGETILSIRVSFSNSTNQKATKINFVKKVLKTSKK